jgi:hypothetical protein
MVNSYLLKAALLSLKDVGIAPAVDSAQQKPLGAGSDPQGTVLPGLAEVSCAPLPSPLRQGFPT